MNMKEWTPVLVASVLVISSVQAFADSGWHYDEDSDTVIHNFSGSTVSQPASQPESEGSEGGTWYYHEGSDSIVYNNEGSRSRYPRSSSSVDTFEQDAYLAFLDQ